MLPLRFKIMGLVALAAIILLGSTFTYHYARTKEEHFFNYVYHENSKASIESILNIKKESFLKSTLNDAAWDEMVDYVHNHKSRWANDNLGTIYQTLDLSLIQVYDPGFNLLYSVIDSSHFINPKLSIPVASLREASRHHTSFHFFLFHDNNILEIFGASIVPTIDIKRQTKPQGFLVTGRLWNQQYIKNLQNAAIADLEIIPVEKLNSLQYARDQKESDYVVVQRFIHDGSNRALARLDFIPRTQLGLDRKLFIYFTIIPIVISLLVLLFFFYAIHRWISLPLSCIAQSLNAEDPLPLKQIGEKNKEFFAISERMNAFFEAKKKLENEISERKHAEDRILKLSTALEQSSETVVITDPSGNIEYVNKHFFDISGYSRSEVIGQNPRILSSGLHSKDFYKSMWETISAGNVWKGEFLNKKKNGELYWEFASITPIKDIDDHIINYLSVKEDITERKAAEAKLDQYAKELKESNISKDKFFSILAHDLKSPFHSLLGYTEILANEYDTLNDAERRKFIGILRDSTKNVFDLLENLLQWSRMQSGRLEYQSETFNISMVMEDAVDLLRANALKKNISLTIKTIPDLMVTADKNMIRSVLQNLISNALKFTSGYGSVEVYAMKNSGYIEIVVRDTGIGMTAEELNKLFRIDISFTRKGTSKEVGTGLGLILCKELLQKNGGRIWVESEKNRGSAFHFTLPI